jgi:MFS transporter, DHA1 family, tetracycline resistance protein
MVGAAFLVAVGYGMVAPALPVFALSFDVDVVAASALVSVFAVARIVFAPIGGWAVGRFGETRVLGAGLTVVAASSTACAVATSYPQLLAFRAAGGLGSTMFTVSAAALLIRITPPTLRGRAAGAWSTGFLGGSIAGPIVGGSLMSGSLRAPFLGYAGTLLVAALITGWTLRRNGDLPSASGGGERAALTFVSALSRPAFRAALIANVVNGWTVYGVRVALVPLFVVGVLHRSSGWSGAVLTAFAAGTAAALVLGGRLGDRYGRRPPIIAGSAIVALTSSVLGFTGSLAALLVVALFSGVGTGLMNPPVNAAVGDVIAGDSRDVNGGSALAGFQMVGDIGAVIGPVISGLLAGSVGYPAAFSTCTLVAFASFVSWLRAPETGSR